MTDDGEIEFLDEDADIVQQCVQNVEPEPDIKPLIETTLLVERVKSEKPRKRRKKEEDTDYDPSEDAIPRGRKKRQHNFPRQNAPRGRPPNSSYVYRNEMKDVVKPRKHVSRSVDIFYRKKLDIRIPDYDDPLCLPVRALRKDEWDARKLRNWNNLCLDQFKNYDNLLRAEKEPTISSKRTVVLRNMFNKMTGKLDTTMYSKICVENKNEVKKSEVVQSVLPKYRERQVLNTFKLSEGRRRKSFVQRDEVLLNKEVNKDVETLVVYKPAEKLSLVYKMFEKKGAEVIENDDEDKKYLKEIASCKTCAPCYQTSWRGFNKNNKKNIRCQVCMRPCISVYNLLAHLKCHNDEEIKMSKRAISRSLAASVEYHYKCRLCQEQFLSIRDLRVHIKSHKGTETFKCEVGSHYTT